MWWGCMGMGKVGDLEAAAHQQREDGVVTPRPPPRLEG